MKQAALLYHTLLSYDTPHYSLHEGSRAKGPWTEISEALSQSKLSSFTVFSLSNFYGN